MEMIELTDVDVDFISGGVDPITWGVAMVAATAAVALFNASVTAGEKIHDAVCAH